MKNWTLEDLQNLYSLSLLELLSKSHRVHIEFHQPAEIQICHLISIKTGGCPEDCKYCSQSSRYKTSVSAQPMASYEEVLALSKKALAQGATRICLGAAWREVKNNKQFDEVLQMISGISQLGVEVCCTLGLLVHPSFAKRLKQAGLYAYNHNLDTSERYYPSIITTRTYQNRIDTLDIAEAEGLSVCCGGILGLGETIQDRLEFLLTLCKRNPHPESVPINRLSPIPGTPLENQQKVSFWEMLRLIAIARILLPKAMLRLSCGRVEMSTEEQALSFFAGANSVFIGEKLLTVGNPQIEKDEEMFKILGIKKRPAYKHG